MQKKIIATNEHEEKKSGVRSQNSEENNSRKNPQDALRQAQKARREKIVFSF